MRASRTAASPDRPGDPHREEDPLPVPAEQRPYLALARRVVRLPDAASRGDLAVDSLVRTEPQERLVAGVRALDVVSVDEDVPDAPAELPLAGEPPLDEDPVAARDDVVGPDRDEALAARAPRCTERTLRARRP